MKFITLGQVAVIERKAATKTECSNLPYVGLEDIEKGTGHFAPSFSMKPQNMLATNFRFTTEHVLYGKLRPYLNKVVCPNFDGVCTTEVLPIRPLKGKLDKKYLWAFLLTSRFVEWASASVSGANLPRLDPKLLEECELPLPPLPEQQRIAAQLSKADRLRRLRRYALEMSRGIRKRSLSRCLAIRSRIRWGGMLTLLIHNSKILIVDGAQCAKTGALAQNSGQYLS